MILTIRRGPSRDWGTQGTATLDDGTQYSSLELPDRNNAPGLSSIPIADYAAVTQISPHFGVPVYVLQFVPGRSQIEIHPGNWAGDTTLGLYSDLLGCIALGTGFGMLQPPEASFAPQMAVLHSRAAFKDFMQRTAGAPLTVRIIGFDDPRLGAA